MATDSTSHSADFMLALVTATRNSIETLPDTLASIGAVRGNIKSFFVDGSSTDGTLECLSENLQNNPQSVLLSQQGTGLYQALNQGILAAIEDPEISHIGLLHSDDKLIPQGFEKFLSIIAAEKSAVFYSGIEFHNELGKLVRVWESGPFSRLKLNTGWMPPHTGMIVKKEVYRDVGLYDPSFGTSADYEWIVRVLCARPDSLRHVPERTVTMRIGGASSAGVMARLRANAMDGRVWARQSRIQSMLVRVCKPMRKIRQYFFVKSGD